jgi:hypothetical protein
MGFVLILKQTAIISVYSINWLVFITKTECVFCAVRAELFRIIDVKFYGKYDFANKVSISKTESMCNWYTYNDSPLPQLPQNNQSPYP